MNLCLKAGPESEHAQSRMEIRCCAGLSHAAWDQVRAGESEAETDGLLLTNTVQKVSMTSGLSRKGKQQVLESPCLLIM